VHGYEVCRVYVGLKSEVVQIVVQINPIAAAPPLTLHLTAPSYAVRDVLQNISRALCIREGLIAIENIKVRAYSRERSHMLVFAYT